MSGLLFDSNAFVRWMQGVYFPDAVVSAIAGQRRIAMSVATPWELEIKRRAGKLVLDERAWTEPRLAAFRLLPIEFEDALAAARLPLHHRDPFDRMIIAQALRRQLTIVTTDRAFDAYDVAVLPA